MTRKGQEEMVGFVLIIVLVTVIAMVFIGINLRKTGKQLPSKEIESFLQASKRYSSECYLSPELRLDIGELIIACSDNKQCLDENLSCSALESVYRGMLERSWKPGKDNPIKSYNLKIYNKDTNQSIINLKNGTCLGTKTGSYIDILGRGHTIKVELEICS